MGAFYASSRSAFVKRKRLRNVILVCDLKSGKSENDFACEEVNAKWLCSTDDRDHGSNVTRLDRLYARRTGRTVIMISNL